MVIMIFIKKKEMESLKKNIRKKLVETQRTKKRVINEQKIVQNRFQILVEENNLQTKKELNKFTDDLLNEIFYMNSQGFDKKVIQEGLLDFLGGLFGQGPSGVGKYIQERIVNFILGPRVLGLPDGFLKDAIMIWFADTPFSEMSKMFTDCNYFVRSLSGTLIEAYAKKLQNEKLGDNAFYDILRNALRQQLESGKMDDVFYNTLSSIICPMLKGMLPKMEDIKNTLKGGAIGAVGKTPAVA